MAEDEKVDGAKIAAQIMSRLSPSVQEKVVKTIQASNPALAEKVQENLFNFEDIATLTSPSVQTLIKDISEQDLLLALRASSPDLKAKILSNLSERRKESILEQLEAMPPARLSDARAAQQRILKRVDELRTAGAVKSESTKDIWV